tara:strand:- start:88 stop:282 length:195 start_codon:yes stop_codon:yes gene_type:complete
MNEFPKVTKAMLKALDERFPMQDFGQTDDITKLNFHYGQRSVINFLKSEYHIQNENILTKPQLK